MQKHIHEQTLALTPLITALRRDIHKHPEAAWCEYRTTSLVARQLTDLGYQVVMGRDAHVAELRSALPDVDVCKREQERAISQGADAALVQRMGNGFTGLWADLECGPEGSKGQGPCIALRFDMDALDMPESSSPQHKPSKEGFASVRDGVMHACGHDGHTAVGMGVAAMLKSMQSQLRGKIRLIFQPAEEGAHGALPMCAAGAMDGVDMVLGLHIGIQAKSLGELITGTSDFLATATFIAQFEGKSAHAGMAPQQGRHAILAACTAVQNLQAISRNSQGDTRINVGQIGGGDAANIIPAHAWIRGETRGITTEVNVYMMEEVKRIVHAAAEMWNCQCTLTSLGECPSGSSDMAASLVVQEVAKDMGVFTNIVPMQNFMASEDFAVFLQKVHENGGIGTYVQVGTPLPSGHHTSAFDFDEAALAPAMELLVRTVAQYLK